MASTAPSIRKRLLLRITGVLFVAWFVAVVVTKFLAWNVSSQFLFDQSQQLAESWVDIVSNPNFANVPVAKKPNQFVLAWRDDDLIVNRSEFTLPKPTVNSSERIEIGEEKWILSTLCKDNVCTAFGFRDKDRKFAVRRYLVVIFIPLFFVFLFSMTAMLYAVNSGLAPLNSLARYLSSKSVNQISNIEQQGADSELVPLIRSINQLMENLRNQLSKERQFLDTCAHELRTPVTALIAQLQLLQAKPSENSQWIDKDKLVDISHTAKRTSRAANQVLNLARNANSQISDNQSNQTPITFDLCELTRQLTSDILTVYPHLECQIFSNQTTLVQADSLAIEMMIGNLIENAGRYTQVEKGATAECHVSIEVIEDTNDTSGNSASLLFVVEDNGTGVPEKDMQSIFERFFRSSPLPDSESPDGIGLGLSIVRDIALRYRGSASAERSEKLGGLKTSVLLRDIVVC